MSALQELTVRLSAQSPDEWQVIALKTPTLPPATHTNCLVIGRDQLTLIDPASPYEESQRALERYLDERIEEGARVARVALTHHHPDHIGGVERLIARYGCEVAAHLETARRVPFEVNRSVEDVCGAELYGPLAGQLLAVGLQTSLAAWNDQFNTLQVVCDHIGAALTP